MQSYMRFNHRLGKDFVEACMTQCQALPEAMVCLIYLFIYYTSKLHFEMEGRIKRKSQAHKDLSVSWENVC